LRYLRLVIVRRIGRRRGLVQKIGAVNIIDVRRKPAQRAAAVGAAAAWADGDRFNWRCCQPHRHEIIAIRRKNIGCIAWEILGGCEADR